MQCVALPLSVRVQWVTSYITLIQSLLNTFLSVPYNNPFVLKLSTVKALGCVFTAVRLFAAVGLFIIKNGGENHLIDSPLLSAYAGIYSVKQ